MRGIVAIALLCCLGALSLLVARPRNLGPYGPRGGAAGTDGAADRVRLRARIAEESGFARNEAGGGDVVREITDVHALLRARLRDLPPGGVSDPAWLQGTLREVPGGVQALIAWFFSAPASQANETASAMSWLIRRGISGSPKAARPEVRDALVRAFERMDPPSLAKWSVGHPLLVWCGVRVSDFEQPAVVEAAARRVIEEHPGARPEILAEAARLGLRGRALTSEIINILEAGVMSSGHHQESWDPETFLRPSLGLLCDSAQSVPSHVVERMLQSQAGEVTWAGHHLRIRLNPRAPDEVARSLVRYPPSSPWYESLVQTFLREYGQAALPHLPTLLRRQQVDTLQMAGVVEPSLRPAMTAEDLARAVEEGLVGWDPEKGVLVRHP